MIDAQAGRLSLPTRLLLLLLALAIPMVALAVVGLSRVYQAERERAEAGLLERTRALAALVDGPFANADTALRIAANHPALAAGDLVTFEVALRRASADMAGAPFALYDLSGVHLINTSWKPGYVPPAPITFAPAITALAAGKLYISDLLRSNATGKLVIPVELPIPQGRPTLYVLGTMVASAQVSRLLQENQQPEGPEQVAVVLDRAGAIVARTRDNETYAGTPGTPQLRAAIGQSSEGVIHDVQLAGDLASVMSFSHAPLSGFTVALLEPESAFEAPIRNSIGRTLTLAALLLAVGVTIAVLLAGNIVSALRRMNESLERTVAERTAELTASEARMRGYWENAPEALFLISVDDDGNCRLQHANPTHQAMAGPQPAIEADTLAPPYETQFPPDQAAELHGHLTSCITTGQPQHVATSLDFATGRYDLELVLVPLPDEYGRISLVLGSARDITSRKRLQAELAQAQKMQALGQLAGGIAHDINNVLQAVLTSASLLEGRADDVVRVRQLARGITEAATRGASVTHRLLAFSHRGDLRATAVDARGMLEGLHDMLAHTLGPDIHVVLQIADQLPPMRADKGQLETVLLNLATNARDAMPRGGTLVLAAAEEVVSERHIGGVKAGHYIRLAASDSGQGMDDATLARVTEPFFTTKRRGEGTGLGLAMARGFAEQSGGALAVSSRLGIGTEVMLWLPLADATTPWREDDAPAPNVAPQPAPTLAAWPRLLLVDDDRMVRESLQAELEADGCTVITADSGEAALAMLGRLTALDSNLLLVTDLSMPGMDGMALIRAARRHHPDLPAILLSGHAPALANSVANPFSPGGSPGSTGQSDHLPGLRHVVWLQKPVTLAHLREVTAALVADGVLA